MKFCCQFYTRHGKKYFNNLMISSKLNNIFVHLSERVVIEAKFDFSQNEGKNVTYRMTTYTGLSLQGVDSGRKGFQGEGLPVLPEGHAVGEMTMARQIPTSHGGDLIAFHLMGETLQ